MVQHSASTRWPSDSAAAARSPTSSGWTSSTPRRPRRAYGCRIDRVMPARSSTSASRGPVTSASRRRRRMRGLAGGDAFHGVAGPVHHVADPDRALPRRLSAGGLHVPVLDLLDHREDHDAVLPERRSHRIQHAIDAPEHVALVGVPLRLADRLHVRHDGGERLDDGRRRCCRRAHRRPPPRAAGRAPAATWAPDQAGHEQVMSVAPLGLVGGPRIGATRGDGSTAQLLRSGLDAGRGRAGARSSCRGRSGVHAAPPVGMRWPS
jgi:hypothetical protein